MCKQVVVTMSCTCVVRMIGFLHQLSIAFQVHVHYTSYNKLASCVVYLMFVPSMVVRYTALHSIYSRTLVRRAFLTINWYVISAVHAHRLYFPCTCVFVPTFVV